MSIKKMIAMLAAAELGDVNKLEELLVQLPLRNSINEVDYRGRTALHLAAERGHDNVTALLLSHGIDFTAEDCGNFTALHLAAEFGHDKIVAQLLAKSPELAEVRAYGALTCIHLAAIKGHTTIVKQLAATNIDLINDVNDLGKVALDLAIEHDHQEIVAVLVDSLRATSDDDRNVKEMFHGAIVGGYERVVSQLVAQHPHVIDTVDSEGSSALQLAASYDHPAIVHWLLNQRGDRLPEAVGGTYKMSMLHFAAQHGYHTLVARLLVEQPYLIDVEGTKGMSALHLAAQGGHEKVVELLLAAQPTLATRVDVQGKTALHYAALFHRMNVLEQLLAHNPELIDVEDRNARTALFSAAYGRDKHRDTAIAFLLARGARRVTEEAFWATLTRTTSDASDENLHSMFTLNPELIHSLNALRSTVLHRVFGFRREEEEEKLTFFTEGLMMRVWEMDREALHKPNREDETPFHVAVRSNNKFAIKLVQSKLSLDEIMDISAKYDKECPQAPLDQLRETLLETFNKDIAGVVYDYSVRKDEKKTNKNKRRRGEDDDDNRFDDDNDDDNEGDDECDDEGDNEGDPLDEEESLV